MDYISSESLLAWGRSGGGEGAVEAKELSGFAQGLKKADQQAILDEFSKHRPAITHPSTAPTVAISAPPPSQSEPASTPSTTAAVAAAGSAASAAAAAAGGPIASREDVLTRAAALGRGAATTGFKRFLALTEAAKDRKDGPFRKLFNP